LEKVRITIRSYKRGDGKRNEHELVVYTLIYQVSYSGQGLTYAYVITTLSLRR